MRVGLESKRNFLESQKVVGFGIKVIEREEIEIFLEKIVNQVLKYIYF